MRVLFDTNVILDVLLNRKPFHDSAAPLFAKVEHGDLTGVLGATTLTTIHYLMAKALGKAVARTTVRKLIKLFHVAAVDVFSPQQLQASLSETPPPPPS